MKKSLLFFGLTTLVLALPAAADEQKGAWKQTATFFTTSILGAAVAGPFGLAAGAMGGTWLAGNVREADAAGALRTDLGLASLVDAGPAGPSLAPATSSPRCSISQYEQQLPALPSPAAPRDPMGRASRR